jgi:hypothetical protein
MVRRQPQILVEVEERGPGERDLALRYISTSLRYIPKGVVPVGRRKTVEGSSLSLSATASAAAALMAS